MGSIIPVGNLHTIGMVKDSPSVTIPPSGFTSAVNVRFKDSSVEKATGSQNLITKADLAPLSDSFDIKYVAAWSNPNIAPLSLYYVVVVTNGNVDQLYLLNAQTKSYTSLNYTVTSTSSWQHTIFQGGYAIVLNNGTSRPVYILDEKGNTNASFLEAYELPGWDSYNAKIDKINDQYDPLIHIPDFDIGEEVDFTANDVVVDVISGATGARKFRQVLQGEGTEQQATLFFDTTTNTHVVSLALAPGGVGAGAFTEFLEDGDNVIISVRSIDTVQIRCGVIKAWGDKLVAGNLTEIDSPTIASVATDGSRIITFTRDHNFVVGDKILLTQPAKIYYTIGSIPASNQIQVTAQIPAGNYANARYTIVSAKKGIRDLPGVIRISDVAAPGSIPNNWNPYSAGVSTADEFQLATTGIVTELAEMQGNLYVYTNNSIHAIVPTNNSFAPYIAQDISYSYGALSEGSVLEFNGVHIVVGSNDIYKFSGHPASIESLAADRVQSYFYEKLNTEKLDNMKLLFNRSQNEVWIVYPNKDNNADGLNNEVLVWNYRFNVWSEFDIPAFVSVDMGPSLDWDGTTLGANVNPNILRPILTDGKSIYGADFKGYYLDHLGNTYESYVTRVEAPLTPEFDVESVNSTVLWVNKDRFDKPDVDLELRFRGTNVLDETFAEPLSSSTLPNINSTFTVGKEYKTDSRFSGRFLSYRVTDLAQSGNGWRLSGMQFDIGKGGRR